MNIQIYYVLAQKEIQMPKIIKILFGAENIQNLSNIENKRGEFI